MSFSSRLILFSITMLTLNTQCKSEKPSKEEVGVHLQVLEGLWQMQPNLNSYEEWKMKDGKLQGRGFTINKGDTVVSEFLSLGMSNESYFYEATVLNQNNGAPIPFELTDWTTKRFRFENAEHDFPSLIQYRFENKNNLEVLLRGDIQGIEQDGVMNFKRIK